MVDTTNNDKVNPTYEYTDGGDQDEAEQWGNSLLEEMDIFSFATAYEYIKEGKKVSRRGWNNQRIWIILYNKGNKYYRGINLNGFRDFIVMMTIGGKYIPWTPSQTDLLTEDWILI
jgi:hypothetical protein